MARRPSEVRREEILQATVEQIAVRGLADVRVVDIASSLGVSTALVFYHFETKERLVAEAFAHQARRDLKRLDRVLGSAAPPARRLTDVISLYGPTGSGTSWSVWIEAWAAAIHEPQIRATWQELDRRWRDALLAVIAAGVAAGDFRCADPTASAWRIGSLIDGLAVQVVVNDTAPKRRVLMTWARRAAAVEVGLPPDALDER